jgi:hypothetical protein
VRSDGDDGLADGPVTVWGHFGQRTPMEIPACWLKRSPSEGRSSGGKKLGGEVGSYLPLFLMFILLFIVTSRGVRLRGSILPPVPRCRPSGIKGMSPLPPYLQPFTVDMVGLLPHRTLR